MKTETAPQKMSGSIPWGWLIALALLITAAGAALWLLPKPTPHTAPPPVVRAKVPPAPPAEEAPTPESSTGPADGLVGASDQASDAQQAETAEAPTTEAGGDESPLGERSDDTPPAETTHSRPSEPQPSPAASPTASTIPASEPSAPPGETAIPAETSPPAPGSAKGASDAVLAPSADSIAPPSARPAPTAARGYTIQVGAYRNKANAEAQMADLTQRGYDAYLFEVTDAQQRSFYMVRFGHFSNSVDAARKAADFTEAEKIQAVIVRAGAM